MLVSDPDNSAFGVETNQAKVLVVLKDFLESVNFYSFTILLSHLLVDIHDGHVLVVAMLVEDLNYPPDNSSHFVVFGLASLFFSLLG